MKRNFIDRVIERISPTRAMRIYHASAKLDAVTTHFDKIARSQKRKYDAATKGRHYSDWNAQSKSVNQEVMQDLTLLRERSRELARNNPYMINAVRAIKNGVVGTGIVPTFSLEGLSKNQQKSLKKEWDRWADKTTCDYDDMNTFSGLQSLILKTVVESGECFVRKVRGTSKDAVPLRIQIFEGDFIDCTHDTFSWAEDGTRTAYGIKYSKDGRRLGYWIFKTDPYEFGGESEFVKASDIIHVYETERPGQQRGVPFSCGVMTRLKDLDDYEMTERMRSKVAASFAVFITDELVPGEERPTNSQMPYETEQIEPGMITTLSPGQQIQTAQPPPAVGVGDFIKNVLRGVSAGFGTSYENLSNDYSNVNFSSGRMGWIEFNKHVEHLQWTLMVPRLCDKLYLWFLEACQLKGIIPSNIQVDVKWTAPRREMIDPYKEIQALKEGLRAGLFSWQDVVRTFGIRPEDLKSELAQDKKMFDDLGLKPTIDPRFDPNRPEPEADKDLMKD